MKLPVRLGLALAAVTCLAYVGVLGHSFTNLDDDTYVTANEALAEGLTPDAIAWAFTAFHSTNWHPLTWISHAIDVSLFGMNPAGHHATNVLLHALAAVLLFVLLRRTTGALWRSALVAAFFAWHPLRVESVAWVAERKDVLSACFAMGTLLAYRAYVKRPGIRRGLAVAGLFACGLMAKPMLVTLPFAMLLLDVWPLRRPARLGRLLAEKAVLLPLVAASIALTLAAQRPAVMESIPFVSRLANAALSYVGYLGMTIWPHPLATPYPYDTEGLTPLRVAGACVLLLAITAGAWVLRRRAPYVLVGWLWYLGTAVPVIGLVQVGNQALADRYTYLPSIGLFVALVWGLHAIVASRTRARTAALGVASLALVACLVLTVRQVRVWRDSGTLFAHTLSVTGDQALVHNNLGLHRISEGRVPEAIAHFEAVLEEIPHHTQARNNLAMAYVQTGRREEAERVLRGLVATNPDNTSALLNLAILRHMHGDTDGARRFARRALAADPSFTRARAFLEQVLGEGSEP